MWQRCQVHFLRNILLKAPKKNTEEFRTDIKALFKIQDINLARKMKYEIFPKIRKRKKFQSYLNTLDEGLKMLEVRRREKVIRIFMKIWS
ncbi:transposase [Campylobacter ureolyticus]|uniref:transposase n=1 Tax=Campylobacter ureolyticus TaxID=827 RepID=UPI0034DB472E